VLAVKVYKVNRELHAEGVHGLTRYDPHPLPRGKALAPQQALGARWATVGKLEAARQFSAARDVADHQGRSRRLPAMPEQATSQFWKEPARQVHCNILGFSFS
jgi:hypothetical protein